MEFNICISTKQLTLNWNGKDYFEIGIAFFFILTRILYNFDISHKLCGWIYNFAIKWPINISNLSHMKRQGEGGWSGLSYNREDVKTPRVGVGICTNAQCVWWHRKKPRFFPTNFTCINCPPQEKIKIGKSEDSSPEIVRCVPWKFESMEASFTNKSKKKIATFTKKCQ